MMVKREIGHRVSCLRLIGFNFLVFMLRGQNRRNFDSFLFSSRTHSFYYFHISLFSLSSLEWESWH